MSINYFHSHSNVTLQPKKLPKIIKKGEKVCKKNIMLDLKGIEGIM